MNLGIYYFSGTGNSLAVAKQIHKSIPDSQIYAIAKENEKKEINIDCQSILFVFPSYAYEMPKFVHKFIKRANIASKYIGAICTYGSSAGAAFAEMRRLLKNKNCQLNYSAGIRSVENYIPMFKLPTEEQIAVILKNQQEQVKKIIKDISEQNCNQPPKHSFVAVPIAKLFRTFKGTFALFYRVDKTCTSCGLCSKLCPAQAIKMKNGKPRFTMKCEQCQGCLNFCPQKSIKFIRYTKNSRRYNHPDVKGNEINQYK